MKSLFVLIAGLEILAFPCNQFGEEEPGSNKQILEFVCTRFKSEFPVFDKVTELCFIFLFLGLWPNFVGLNLHVTESMSCPVLILD